MLCIPTRHSTLEETSCTFLTREAMIKTLRHQPYLLRQWHPAPVRPCFLTVLLPSPALSLLSFAMAARRSLIFAATDSLVLCNTEMWHCSFHAAINTRLKGANTEYEPDCEDSPYFRIRNMDVLEAMRLFGECGFDFLPETSLPAGVPRSLKPFRRVT